MKTKTLKWSSYLVLLFVFIFSASALTIDELLAGYKTDGRFNQANNANVTGYNYSGLDVGGTASYDYFIISLNITASTSGTYSIVGDLYDSNNYLAAPKHQIKLQLCNTDWK